MWLLDSKTLELKGYYDNSIPPYAILSHAWGKDEVSFQQINGPRAQIQSYTGFIKIQKCCAQAATDGFEHVWIDTCCIDKTNSAELSEAINSMFNWYKNATECYVYLADVTSKWDLAASKWFTRGWTLQELIAPASAIFLNKKWSEIGTKLSLAQRVSTITKIPVGILLRQEGQEFSVAQVMSWAANRQTTRVEDIGYCLLGIFGVNMPMIYGEGEKAFLRLQHEIIKASTDQSLFAWTMDPLSERNPQPYQSAFARSPADFEECGTFIPHPYTPRRSEFLLTNRGLRIEVELVDPTKYDDFHTAYLSCSGRARGRNDVGQLGIPLLRIGGDRYVRGDPRIIRTLDAEDDEWKRKETIYIVDSGASSFGISKWQDSFPREDSVTFIVPKEPAVEKCGFFNVGAAHYPPRSKLYPSDHNGVRVVHNSKQCSIAHMLKGASAFKFQHESNASSEFIVVFGITSTYRIWSDIEPDFGSDEELTSILGSYYRTVKSAWVSRYRGQARENVRDRVTVSLRDGSRVNVALKKVLVSGKIQYMVNITIN